MIDSGPAVILTVTTGIVFVVAGVWSVRRRTMGIEDFLVARGSAGARVSTATLVASVIGAWVLLGPAEAGTWAGIVGVVGYGVGQAAPLLAFMLVGPKMRRLMPEGHSLTEYVFYRYGPAMYVFTLAVIVFYMFIFLSAELTGISQAVRLLADTPLWLTAGVVGLMTVGYTAYGGIRASIFTDTIQFGLILPLLAVSFVAAVVAIGGLSDALDPVRETAPQLLSFTFRPGVEFAFTLIIAILAANMFHQGFWQRVYAVKDPRALVSGFGVAGAVVVPVIFLAGLLGIMAVGQGPVDDPSVALFALISSVVPTWAVLVVMVLALVLVMSSLDTLLNGIASVVTADLARFKPELGGARLLRSSRGVTVALILPAIFIASRGYSVLYLFLIADVVCSAAVFPVFWGLFAGRFGGTAALASAIAGLVAGVLLFPTPDAPYLTGWIVDIDWASQLLVSFSLALGVSIACSLGLTVVASRLSVGGGFNFSELRERVRLIEG